MSRLYACRYCKRTHKTLWGAIDHVLRFCNEASRRRPALAVAWPCVLHRRNGNRP